VKLKYKLPLILFIAFVAIITLTFAVSLTNSAKAARASQYEMGRSMATVQSEEVRGFLENKITELKALERNIQAIMYLSDKDKADILGRLLYSISDQPVVSDAYVTFERGAYFGADKTEAGKYYNIEAFLSESGKREIFLDPVEVADDDDWYNGPKETKKIHMTEPYGWTYPDENRERKMFTLSAPIMVNGKFVGVAGIDLQLDLLRKHLFDKMADDKRGAYVVLVSNDGLMATHPMDELVLGEIGEDMEAADRQALKDAIKNGEYHRVLKKSLKTGDFSLVSYVPMLPSGLESPWSIASAVSLEAVQAEAKEAQSSLIMLGISCAVAWGIFLLIFMSAIFGNITRTVAALGKMTEGDGDLTIRFDERGKDEFGQMARGLNSLMEKLHATIKTTQTEAKNLSNTSSSLLGLSDVLSKSSETTLYESINASRKSDEANENVQGIASEAERASANASLLLTTAEKMGSNIDTVISAVEEMHESFGKMTANTRVSKTVSGEAIEKAANAMSVMDALGASVKEVGQFTDVIKTIAKKTNMLALNASVEASRAGEAGKGFAVVAGEVKQLANQSASSANDISQRIENIQTGTAAAINVIRDISTIITKISESANSISESVERQMKVSENMMDMAKQTNAGAHQVVQSVGDVAASIQTSAKHANIAADGTKEVSDGINVIHEDAGKTNAYSKELKEAANSLKSMAEELDSVVCRFRT
jgi:methyl-accepting chemotaxis protein